MPCKRNFLSRLITALFFDKPVLLASVIITALLLEVRQFDGLETLELVVFDQMVRLQPDAGSDPRLLVVAITEVDIQTLKQWPLKDQTVAQLLENLQRYQPKVIGLDLYRDISHPPGRQALLEQLQAPNIIAITKLEDPAFGGVAAPPGVPEKRVGFSDLVIDPDGVVRRNLMFASIGKDNFYSFSLRLSLSYLADQDISLKISPTSLQLGKTAFVPIEANSGGYQTIDAQGYQVLLNYRSPHKVAQQVTLTQALNGQLNPEWVKDKVVLIGATAPSANDSLFTPYSVAEQENPKMPGILVHAQMVSQIFSAVLDERSLFWFWSQWSEVLWIWGWSLLGGMLAWWLRHPLSLGLTVTIALGGLFGISYGIFTLSGWIPLVASALAFVATSGSVVAYKLRHYAFHDALTELPNRALFLKRLQRVGAHAKRHEKSSFDVLFLNVDRFKVVNESLGRQVGDQLLVAITGRLKACLGPTEIVARVGGDEFAILLKDIDDISAVTSEVERLQSELTLPFNSNGQEMFITVSVGIAFNQAGHECQPEDLLRDAHTAMYRAKTLGQARQEVFSTAMRFQSVTRWQLETDLRRAISGESLDQEFRLYYQPIVSLATGRIAGFEALVRWQHSQRGFVSPADFIPVTEEIGLIIPLGQWIFQEACRQLQIWQNQFPMNPPLMISVNLSSLQFSQPDLVEEIEQTLQATGLDGRSLKLEITESFLMNDVESAIALLLRLKALNIRLSIDDFGTGYSSLSYLNRFPIDTLKVDQSFVSRIENTSEDVEIVQAIVTLAHNLGMDIVAEGIETAVQLAKLRALKCEYGQGYFFSKPLDSEVAAVLLAACPQW